MTVPVTFLRGVKTAREAQLSRLGIYTVDDLYEHYPKGYENRSNVCKISDICSGESATVCAYVKSVETRQMNYKISITNIRVYDETGNMNISFFSGKYYSYSFHSGELYAFYGKVTEDQYGLHMTNPVCTQYKDHWENEFFQIQPVYTLTQGLTQNIMRKIVLEALKDAPIKYETLPHNILDKYDLMPRDEALKNIHFPQSAENINASRRRFKFEELFTMQLHLLLLKDANVNIKNGISFGNNEVDEKIRCFIKTLPFELSDGQKKVWKEISDNMDSVQAMNRLVIGDVGSGKTILAILAILKAALSGFQAVYMAPTEILAEQHYTTIKTMFENIGIKTMLVTGSLNSKEKKEVMKAIETGEAQCIIGTHALIQPTVKYYKLGLAITDEQHRFGVRQRAMLSNQENSPDILVMTATPIPRTLALILYGDMDISKLTTLPVGRIPIKTYALNYAMYDRICNWIIKLVSEGRQVYIVYPLIDEGEEEKLKAVTKEFARMSKQIFKDINCGILHGKMTTEEKESVMREYKEGRISILFSTTVIEVGVDVANAALMVVENAERFGLAQLHQLRGRVGRSNIQSYCVLLSEKVTERMKIMEKVSDGFELSERDLELRGPGDFFGVEQHGLPQFKIANLYQDEAILKMATEAAAEVLSNKTEYNDFIKYIGKKYPERIPL